MIWKNRPLLTPYYLSIQGSCQNFQIKNSKEKRRKNEVSREFLSRSGCTNRLLSHTFSRNFLRALPNSGNITIFRTQPRRWCDVTQHRCGVRRHWCGVIPPFVGLCPPLDTSAASSRYLPAAVGGTCIFWGLGEGSSMPQREQIFTRHGIEWFMVGIRNKWLGCSQEIGRTCWSTGINASAPEKIRQKNKS